MALENVPGPLPVNSQGSSDSLVQAPRPIGLPDPIDGSKDYPPKEVMSPNAIPQEVSKGGVESPKAVESSSNDEKILNM